MTIKTRKELKMKDKKIDNFIMGKDADNEEDFKYITTKITEKMHAKLKVYCVMNRIAMNDTVVGLIEEFLRNHETK